MAAEPVALPPFALSPSDELAQDAATTTAATATKAKNKPRDRDSDNSELSLAVSRAYWVAVVTTHLCVGLFFYGYANVYSHVKDTASEDPIVARVRDTSVERFYTPVMIVSSAIAIGHTVAIVNALLSSYRSRELLFSPDIWLDGPNKRATLVGEQRRNRDKWCVLRAFFAVYYKLEKRGLYLDQVLSVVEVSLQIFQCSKLSRLVASGSINRLMAAAVVLVCWCVPLVHFAFRRRREKSPASEVVAQHAVNVCLAVVYGMAIPLAIFSPYSRDMDGNSDAFPSLFYFMDTWSARAELESEQVFVSSWTDFVAKMAPGLTLLYQLRMMQTLLHVSPRSGSSSRRRICFKLPPPSIPTVQGVVKPGAAPADSSNAEGTGRRPPRGRIRYFFDTALFCAGVVVLSLSSRAQSVAGSTPFSHCLLEMRPWRSAKRSCAVLEVSCANMGSGGAHSDVDLAIANVHEAATVKTLILSHCAALEVPASIRLLSSLTTLKIHNSTIKHWGEAAALTSTSHSELARVYVSQTNMSGIPLGLLSADFPSRVNDIYLCETNLTDLPANLHEKWRGTALTLGLELSPGIAQFPETLSKLQMRHLSLASNGISSIPDTSLRDQQFVTLMLSGNPLASLPSSVGHLTHLTTIDISGTSVKELPVSWSDKESASDAPSIGSVQVQATGTPLCANIAQDTAAAALNSGWFQVTCVEAALDPTLYPLTHEVQWRSSAS